MGPQTPDQQRAWGDADQFASLAFDQPEIEQDVAQLRQARQSLKLYAAQAAALARRVQLLGGAVGPSMAVRTSDTPDYSDVVSWLTMFMAEVQTWAKPKPALLPKTIAGPANVAL